MVLALPLLEEANRTRSFAVTLLRLLAARGIGGALPDLPGTGESLVATRDMTVLHLREAFEAAVEHVWAGRRVFSVAIRSGALLDTLATVAGRWHLAPQDGAELVREFARMASPEEAGPVVEVAGNLLARSFIAELGGVAAVEAEGMEAIRTVRLATDPRTADRKIAAQPLWRRSEPGSDSVLAELLAGDIAEWIAACGA